jgi:hypothetical protein
MGCVTPLITQLSTSFAVVFAFAPNVPTNAAIIATATIESFLLFIKECFDQRLGILLTFFYRFSASCLFAVANRSIILFDGIR